jgi:NAD(P)-dependent dehydrogenase (short-subunit alcohol dehydrogenase family)
MRTMRRRVALVLAAAEDVSAHGLVADVTEETGLQALFGGVDERCGRLDVLVANAGGPPFLASADAGYVTGQSILIDGGLAPTLP